jgi:hypothetical protein
MWSAAVRMQRQRRPRVAPLLPEEVTQRQASMLRVEARKMRTDVTGVG